MNQTIVIDAIYECRVCRQTLHIDFAPRHDSLFTMVIRSVEDDDWDHLDFERDDHLEEFCRERLNRVGTILIKMLVVMVVVMVMVSLTAFCVSGDSEDIVSAFIGTAAPRH